MNSICEWCDAQEQSLHHLFPHKRHLHFFDVVEELLASRKSEQLRFQRHLTFCDEGAQIFHRLFKPLSAEANRFLQREIDPLLAEYPDRDIAGLAAVFLDAIDEAVAVVRSRESESVSRPPDRGLVAIDRTLAGYFSPVDIDPQHFGLNNEMPCVSRTLIEIIGESFARFMRIATGILTGI